MFRVGLFLVVRVQYMQYVHGMTKFGRSCLILRVTERYKQTKWLFLDFNIGALDGIVRGGLIIKGIFF